MTTADNDSWRTALDRIATEVTAKYADAVDRDARFPGETIDALRETRLLALPVPVDFGGPGGSIHDVCAIVRRLGGLDASVGLILCMHYSQIFVLARHITTDAHRRFLTTINERQMLIANVNSEMGVGGNERRSTCFIDDHGDGRFSLTKDTPVVSYGESADAYFVTARRTSESAAGDQVIGITTAADTVLTPLGSWDALGLRGSGSRPFHIEASGDTDLLIGDYAGLVTATGLPVTNLLFCHFWLGLAEQAARVAHGYGRKRYRGRTDVAVPALRLADLSARLDQMRAVVAAADRMYDDVIDTEAVGLLSTVGAMQALKTTGTGLLEEIALAALAFCGVAGYASNGAFSVSRLVRDALGARLMVNNDAVLLQNGEMLFVRKEI